MSYLILIRYYIKKLMILLICLFLARCAERENAAELVNPHIDSANSRWIFFASACRPFGMVNLSPDNLIKGTWGSGYQYHVEHIKGFSHIHSWQLSGIAILPVTGEVDPTAGPDVYGSKFSHATEIAKPGYHRVFLDDYGVEAELTSTTRVGFHRYTFPADQAGKIIINLGGPLGPAEMINGLARKCNDNELEGYTVNGPTRRRPKTYPVFFVMKFDQPVQKMDGWRKRDHHYNISEISGDSCGAVLHFDKNSNQVKVKVGISYVSIQQARLNLETELAHWDFDRIREESREEWNDWLNRIEIEGGNQKQRIRFYTDLWHALLGRRIISDVNGKYSDMTGEQRRTGQIPLDENGKPLFNHYNSDSFWGAQWTLNTLWHLVYPEVSGEFCNSMLQMYKDGGLIPRGPSGGNYTFVMTGASSTPFFVSAYMKRIRGFDVDLAYEGLRKNHLPGGLMSKAGYEHNTYLGGGIEAYIEKGYVPYPLHDKSYGFHQDGAGQTLEYAFQDWTLSQLAKVLGKKDDYQMFRERAFNYNNLYDSSIGWMRPKQADGSWKEPFDILDYDHGWVEGTAAQFTWWVPHDVQGLIQLMGGKKVFNDKLNLIFEGGKEHDFVSAKSHDAGETRANRRRYINYGNQPCMHMAFLFNYSSMPWLTQYWSRQIIEQVYSDVSPDLGYSGDEDQGFMGALSVLMKIGLFQMRAGCAINPIYEIGSPIFDSITIHLNPEYYPGKKFVIQTKNNNADNVYIQSAQLNGKPLNTCWFYHSDLVNGGKLILEMGPEANESWASEPEDAPPSLSSE